MASSFPSLSALPLPLPFLLLLALYSSPPPVSAYYHSYDNIAQDMSHQTGQPYNTTAWQATVVDKAGLYLSYGPYAADVPRSAELQVEIYLAIDNNSADQGVVARLDVHEAESDTVLTSDTVHRSDFETVDEAQPFLLYFKAPAVSGARLEYRVYFVGCAALTHFRTVVAQLNDTGPITSFWNDTAHWQFVAQHVFPSPGGSFGANVGFHFVTQPSRWVLFHREYFFSPAPPPSYCKYDYARIVVRTSTDRGLTFSNATVMASPVPNTPYECALVDGAGFFDPQGAPGGLPRWFYLSQGLDRNQVWTMCLFFRDGVDPVGPYTALATQPSVASGQLWKQICGGDGKSCFPSMNSEGTPEIVYKDEAGYYYVTFHGWDPAHVQSARGVAKSRDFVNWKTAGRRLPNDAMFTGADCTPWNISWAKGGCVGGGAASILRSGDYLYMVIEAPDISLGCLTQPGQQNWVLGLLRAPAAAFLATKQWQPFQAVPTVVPVVKQGCYIQYARIFADDAGVYFTYWADNTLQIHKLVPGAGPLPIIAGPPPSSAADSNAGLRLTP